MGGSGKSKPVVHEMTQQLASPEIELVSSPGLSLHRILWETSPNSIAAQ